MNNCKTLIAIPCMDMVATQFMYSLVSMQRVGLSRVTVLTNSLVYSSRNMLAAEAIDSGVDRVLWLDSDIVFGPDLMERLSADMDAGLDYVSGLFFLRKIPTSPLIYTIEENGKSKVYRDYPEDQLFQIGGSGFGAVMMSARILKDVYDHYGPPFTPLQNGWGEDLSFCVRAGELGYKLWCDSRIKVGHVGTAIFGEAQYKAQGGIQ